MNLIYVPQARHPILRLPLPDCLASRLLISPAATIDPVSAWHLASIGFHVSFRQVDPERFRRFCTFRATPPATSPISISRKLGRTVSRARVSHILLHRFLDFRPFLRFAGIFISSVPFRFLLSILPERSAARERLTFRIESWIFYRSASRASLTPRFDVSRDSWGHSIS